MLKKIFIVCIIVTSACKKKMDNSFVYSVPPGFQPYTDDFVKEAAARGRSISINNLIIRYDSSLSFAYCAQSNIISSENDRQKIISVNPFLTCWANDKQLETLLFHEMGHCILGRPHDTSRLPNGDPKSIMYPNNITLYSPCVYAVGDSCDQLYKRSYYLDELFDATAPVPEWGK